MSDNDVMEFNPSWIREFFLPITLRVKRLRENVKLPAKAHDVDACFDIYADMSGFEDVKDGIMINPQTCLKIPTGIATEIPHGWCALVFARSGLATKESLRPANCVAVIDQNYRGEWFIPLFNDSNSAKIINDGDRIAQFMLVPWFETRLMEVDELTETDRGEGGFGSSGKQ